MGMPGYPQVGMPGYPPMMPPGYPGVPYGGYYGNQYQGQQAGSPAASQNQPPHYGGGAPPPPPPNLGQQQSQPPPLPPPAAPMAGNAWTEHVTPEGLRYYYNTHTGTSSWEAPPEMRSQYPQQGRAPHNNVPPLPPLPGNGGAPQLDKAMEGLSINGGGGYAPPQGGMGGQGYSSGMHNGGLGGMGGIGGGLSGLMPGAPDGQGGHLDANGQPVQGQQGGENGMVGWFEQPQVS